MCLSQTWAPNIATSHPHLEPVQLFQAWQGQADFVPGLRHFRLCLRDIALARDVAQLFLHHFALRRLRKMRRKCFLAPPKICLHRLPRETFQIMGSTTLFRSQSWHQITLKLLKRVWNLWLIQNDNPRWTLTHSGSLHRNSWPRRNSNNLAQLTVVSKPGQLLKKHGISHHFHSHSALTSP